MATGYAISTKFIGVDMMSSAFKKMERAGGAMTSKLSAGFKGLGNGLKKLNNTAGKLLSFAGMAGGAYLLQKALRDTIQIGLSFEQTMVNASVRFGESVSPGTKAFNDLNKKAKEIGITTEFTATQAAESFRLLGGAGFSASQAIATSTGLVDLATAANIDLAKATDAAANSLSVFGMMTDDTAKLELNMAKASDVMLMAVNKAKFEVDDYLETMKHAGPIFQASGRSIEEFAAMTAILARAGIKGSLAGTTLKNALLNLQAPTADQAKWLKKMNVEIDDGTGKIKSMDEIVADIAKGTEGWTKIQKSQAMSAVFGKRAVAGMMSAIEIGAPAIKELTTALMGVDGTTQKFAGTVRDTTENKIKLMNSAIEGLQLSIFEGLKPVIVDVTKLIGEWSSQMSAYLEKNPDAIKQITSTAAAVVKLVAGLWALSLVLGAINLVMATNPVVLAVMAIIGALALMIIYWDKVKVFAQTVLAGIAIQLAVLVWPMWGIIGVIGAIGIAIYLLWDNWKIVVDYWKGSIKTLWAVLKAYFMSIAEIITKMLLIPMMGVLEIINKIAKFAGFKGIDIAVDAIDSAIRVVADEAASSRAEAVQMISPEITKAQNDRETREYYESREKKDYRVVIADETGRAKVSEQDNFFSLEKTMTPAR
jgi:TP901 family phage tail tape measure protein